MKTHLSSDPQSRPRFERGAFQFLVGPFDQLLSLFTAMTTVLMPTVKRLSTAHTLLGVVLLALTGVAQAGTWSHTAWTGDSTSNISSARTAWAQHYGSTSAATVNGVTVTGVSGPTISTSQVDVTGPNNFFTGDTNSLTSLGGTGSGLIGATFLYSVPPVTHNVTLKSLTSGHRYTVSFLSVGFDAPGARTVAFTAGSDTLNVDQGFYGNNNGIRVDYTFTASGTTQAISIAPTGIGSFHIYGIALNASDRLIASDTLGASFAAAGNWNTAAAPASGNNYVTGAFTLKTATGSGNQTFAGDSLTIDSGGSLSIQGSGTITANNLSLNGGSITNGLGSGVATLQGTGMTVAANSTLDGGGSGKTLLIQSAMGGSAGLTIQSSGSTGGVVQFTAANTYTGATAISTGATLNLSGAGNANNSDITLAGTGNLTFTATDGRSFTKAITGSGGNVSFNVAGNTSDSGGGDATSFGMSNTGAFTGTVVVNTGLVSASSNASFGNTANVIQLNAASGQSAGLMGNGLTLASTRAIQLTQAGGNSVFRAFGGSTFQIDGQISGAGNLVKTDGGTLILTSANTYTGTTRVGGGVLQINNALALQNSTLNTSGSGVVTLSSVTTPTLGGLSGSTNLASAITTGYSGVTSLTLNPGTGVSNTYSGVVANGAAGMSLVKTGAGTQVLTGANTFTGNVTVSAGTLEIGGTGSILQSSNASTVSVASGATVLLSGSADNVLGWGGSGVAGAYEQWVVAGTINSTGGRAQTLPFGGVTLNGGTLTSATNDNATYGVFYANDSGLVTANGTGNTISGFSVGINGTSVTKTFAVSTPLAGDALTISAVVKDIAAAGSFSKAGAGTVTMTGVNTYTGATTISAGTLALSVGGRLADTTAVNLSGATGTLDISAINTTVEAIGSLAGVASSSVVLGTKNLQVGNANDTSFAGAISGTGALIKVGSGKLTLSGANTYNGSQATQVRVGTLEVATGGSISHSSSSLLVGFSGNSSTLNISGGSVSNGSGTLGGDTNSTGTANVSAGTWTNSGNLSVGVNGTGVVNLTGGTVHVGVVAGTGTVTLGSSGTLNLGTGGTVGTLNAATVTSSSGTAVVNFNHTGSLTFAPSLTGSLVMNKLGTGTTILTGTNTYTGATTVSAGILNLQNATGLGTTAGSTSVSNGATLQLQGGITVGAEALSLNGGSASGQTGALVNVSGTNTYGGAVTVTASSSISAASGSVLNLTGGVVKDGTVATFNGGGTINVNTVAISGSSANSDLVIDGTTVNLGVANTYNGPTFIRNTGTLNANVAGALPTATRTAVTFDGTGTSVLSLGAAQSVASLTAASAATVTLGANTLTVGTSTGSTTFAGIIGGTGGLTKDGASTQVLTGTNTFTGNVTVSAGTLEIGGTGSILNSANASTVTIASGATALLSSTVSNALGYGHGSAEQWVVAGTVNSTGGAAQALPYGGVTLNGGTLTGVAGAGGQAPYGTFYANGLQGAITANGTGNTISAANVGIQSGGTLTLSTPQSADTLTASAVFMDAFGAGALTKTGAGTLTLSGASTYTGATTLSAGTLSVTGSIASSSLTTINGGTLMGTGTVGAIQLNSAGAVNLGTGTLSTGNIAITDGQLVFNVGSTSSYGRLSTSGTVNLTNGGSGAQLVLNAINGYTAQVGDTFTLITNDLTDAISGNFAGLTEGQRISNVLGSSLSGQITYVGGTGNDVVLMVVSPNTAPTLAAISKSGTEDTTVTFTAADFTGSYNDPESTALSSITVATLPATGTLKLSGSNVTASQVIPAANLGNLTYEPAANENGAKTFTVTASDGSLSSTPATTVTMTLTAVNDAPSFTLPAGVDIPAGETWTARESNRGWYPIASSADGSKLAAGVFGGQIYTSTDSGVTWTAREGNRNWFSITSSADGSKLAATVSGGQIYTSTDSGATWTARETNRAWHPITSSADGSKLAALVYNGQIYTSTDSGATWVARESNRNWYSITSSSDGSKLAAVDHGGQIYTSTDSGATWTARESSRNWQVITSSADGSKLVAGVFGGQIYTSTDSGVTWTPRDSTRDWVFITSSSDGSKLAASVSGGQIYTSTDSGATWTARETNRNWRSITSSADGSKLAAVVSGGQIYTSAGAPSPSAVNVAEDAGAQSIPNAAVSISAGPADESAQTVSFTVTNTNNALFSAQPAINASGTLTFTSAADANGSATVSVTATDSSGASSSPAQTFTLTVTPVNDTPTDIALSGNTLAENVSANSTVGTLSTTDVDVADTFTYTLVSGAGSTDNAAFNISGAALRLTASPNFEVQNSYSVRVRSTDAGGAFFEKPFTITITNVNEIPTVTAISPTSGSTFGGTSVTLTGTDFTAGSTVTIGGAAATSVVVSSATSITAVTPAGTAGSASVVVTAAGGSNGANTLYTYVAPDYLITTTGNAIVVTDSTGNGDTLSITEPSAGNIQFAAAGRNFSVNGGPNILGDSGSLSRTSVTSISVDAAAGADTINVGAFTGTLPNFTLNGGTGNDTVNFNGDITFASNANLDVDLQNDSATPGVDAVTVAAASNVIASGTGTITVRASQNATMASGSSLETVNGALIVETNQQATPTTGTFSGFSSDNGLIRATGSGSVTVNAKSGSTGNIFTISLDNGAQILGGTSGTVTVTGLNVATGGYELGLWMNGSGTLISSAGADVVVQGFGSPNASAGSTSNTGLSIVGLAAISAGGSGTVTVAGTAGGGGTGSPGVYVDSGSSITSAGGNVQVTGTGGGTASGSANPGVMVAGSISAAGSGNVWVTGTGGPGSGGGNYGVLMQRSGTTGTIQEIKSATGNVTVTGVTGGGTGSEAIKMDSVAAATARITTSSPGLLTLIGDKINLVSTAVVTNTSGTVTIRQQTNGVAVNLGSAVDTTASTLELSDTELDLITADTVVVGDSNSGTITASAAITHPNNLSLITGAGLTVSQAVTMAVDKNLTVNGVGTLAVNAAIAATGTGAISMTTVRDFVVTGATISTVNGALSLIANAAGTNTAAFTGVKVTSTASVRVTGSGNLTVVGKGGSGGGTAPSGVEVLTNSSISGGTSGTVSVTGTGGTGTSVDTGPGSMGGVKVWDSSSITSSGANVQVTGVGGTGTTQSVWGVLVYVGGSHISAGGTGSVTVHGTGGSSSGGFNNGVDINAQNSHISSNNGPVQVTGIGGVGGATNYGVHCRGTGDIYTGGANALTITGTGGSGTGGGHSGVQVSASTCQISTGGGNIIITGTPGSGGSGNVGVVSGGTLTTATNGGNISIIADSMNLGGTVSTNSSGTLTLRQNTNAVAINLGSAVNTTASTLELSDAELDTITTGTLVIGDANSGLTTISDVISPAGYPTLDIQKALTFSATGGFGADLTSATVFEKLKVNGAVTITAGASLTATAAGGFVPAVGNTFTILDNVSASTTTGSFSSMPEGTAVAIGGVNNTLTYSGGSGNDVVFTATTGFVPVTGVTVTYSAVIGGTTPVAITGGGTLALTAPNTYTAPTNVQAGTVSINTVGTGSNAQSLGAGNVVNLGVANTSSGRLVYTGGAGTLDKTINALGNGGDTIQNSGTGLLTLSGTINKTGTTLTLQGGANPITVSGTITGNTGSPNSDLIVDGGLVTLASANTYNGPTYIINGATLSVNVVDALPTNPARSAILMDQSGSGDSILNLGASQAVLSLTGADTSGIALNEHTLTIGTTSGSTTFTGGIIGSGGLTKDGASTQILSLKGLNNYTGATTVSAGTLTLDNVAGYKTTALSAASGATLSILMPGNATSSWAAVFDPSANAFNSVNAAITGAGLVTLGTTGGPHVVAGGGSGTMTTNMSAGGMLDVQSGQWAWGWARGSAATNNGSVNVASGAAYRSSDVAFQFDSLTGSGTIGNAFNASAVTLTLGVQGTTNNATYGVSSNTATFSGVITSGEFYNNVTTSALNLVKTGSGTQILSGANTYTGTTTISGGTLQIGAGSTTGSLSTSSSITNNATLAFNRSNTITQGTDFASVISGSGAVTQAGTGTLVLSGTNTYTGATTINSGGTLQIGAGGTTGSLATSSSITNNGTLAFNRSNTLTQGTDFASVISGSGAVTYAGSGTLVLNGANTYSGTTTVSGGTLNLSGAGNSNNSDIVMSGGSNLVFTATDSRDFSKAITGTAGTLTFNVAGNTSDSGASNGTNFALGNTGSFTGTVVVNTGLVSFGSNTAFGNTANVIQLNAASGQSAGLLVGGNASLPSTRAIQLTTAGGNSIFRAFLGATLQIDGVISGAGNLVKTDGGNVLLTGANTFTGSTRVGGGELQINNALALQNSTFDTTGSSLLRLTGVTTPTFGGLSGSTNLASKISGYTSGVTSLTINPGTGVSNTYSGVVANGAAGMSLVKTGAGTQIFSGANTYTGTTTVSEGTLSITGSINSSAAIAVNAGLLSTSGADKLANTAAVTVAGGTLTVGGADTVDTLTMSSGTIGGSSTLTATTYGLSGGTVNGNLGTGTINSSGTVALNGTAAATAVNVTAGTLTLGASSALNSATTLGISGGSLVLGNSNQIGNATVTVSGGTLAMGGNSDTVNIFNLSSGSITGSGTLTATTYGLSGGTVNSNLGTGTINSSGTVALNGTAGATAVNVTAGTMTLGASASLNSAATLIMSGGGLTLGASNQISDSTAVGISNFASVLSLGAFSETVGSITLSAANATNLVTGTGTLTATTYHITGSSSSSGQDPLFASTLSLGTGTLNSSGTWSLLSTSAASAVNVSSGFMRLGGSNLLSDSATVTVTAGVISLGSQTDTVGTFNMSGGFFGSGSGKLTAATYNLTGGTLAGNLGAGSATVSTGTVTYSSGGSLDDTSTLTVSSGTLALTTFSDTVAAVTLTGGNITSTTGVLTSTSAYDMQAGSVSAILGGTVGLTKTTAGTVTLTGVNTFSGKTVVGAGTVSISSISATAGANQSLGTNVAVDLGVAATSSGTLVYTGAAGTLAKNINALGNGSDTVQNSGSGLLTLSGTLTKSGTVLTLKGGSNGITVSGVIAGNTGSPNSDLVIDGGTVTLTNANTYNGPTFIRNSGTLNANVTNALPTANGRTAVTFDGTGTSVLTLGADQSVASLTAAGAATVTLNANTLTVGTSSGSTTFAGAIGGTGGLIKDGASTLILSGTNGYTGATTLSAGNLIINGSIGSSTLTTINGGTLLGTGTVGAIQLNSGGVLTPGGASTAGTLSTGSLAIVDGQLVFNLGGTSSYSQLNTTGSINLTAGGSGAKLVLNAISGYAATLGDSFTLVSNNLTNTISGAFAKGTFGGTKVVTLTGVDYVEGLLGSGYYGRIAYNSGAGKDLVLKVVTPVMTVTQSGTGVAAGGTYSFGSVDKLVPAVPLTKTFTIQNTGEVDLMGIVVNSPTGAAASDYSIDLTGTASTLPPGSSTTFTVTFNPSRVGTRAAAIAIDSNALTNNPFNIILTGVGSIARDVTDGWTVAYAGPDAPGTLRNGMTKAVAVQKSTTSDTAVAVFATGYTSSASGGQDIYTAKYHPVTGALLWAKTFNGAANLNDQGAAIAVDSSGNVVITGYTTKTSTDADVYVAKYASADGTLLWQKTYAGAGGNLDAGVSVAVDASDNVAVAGYGFGAAGGMDFFAARYSSDGSTTYFERLIDGGSNRTDSASSVAVNSAGDLAVAGYIRNAANNMDFKVMKLDATAGTTLWQYTFNGSSNTDDGAYAVAFNAADEVIATGYARAFNYDLYTVKLSGSGVLVWQRQWNGPFDSSDTAYQLAIDSNSDVIVGGTSYRAASVQDGYVVKYSGVDGSIVWDRRFNGPAGLQDLITSVAIDKLNNVVATGYSQNAAGNYDVLTAKMLADDGGLMWEQRYDGIAGRDDSGTSVAISPDGNVFVAGYATQAAGTTDFLVKNYQSNTATVQAAQTITFANPGAQNANVPLTLVASADSGLTVRFTVVSGSATFDSSGNTLLNFTGSGSVTVRATQSGSAVYAAATPVEQTFTVGKVAQTISFVLPATLNSSAQWPLTGVASSGLAVTYNVQSGPGSITDGVLSFSGAGDVTVRASQAGDGRFNAASNVDAVVTSQNRTPVVIFDNIAENWRDTYAGSGAGVGNDIALQLSGNNAVAGFVAGYTTTSSTGKDLYLVKYLADGTLVWSVASGTSGDDEAMSVVVDGNGDVVVAGYVTGTGRDLYVAKYNGTTGNKIWDYTYSGTGSGNDVGVSLALDGTTNVVVGGYAVGSGTSNDFFAAKLNLTTGALVWASVRNRTGATSDVPAKVAVGTDGSVALAGATNSDAWTIKLAAADGTLVWQVVYNFLNRPDAVRGLGLDAANNVIIAAFSQGSNYDIYTAKYSSLNGTLIWGKRYNSSFNSSDHPWDLAVDEDSNVYVTGASFRAASVRDGMTLKYAGLDGTLLWEGRYNGTSSANDENFTISLDGIGNPVISGYTTNSDGTTDVYLAKHNKVPGTIRWQRTFDGANNKNDSIQKVKVDPNGNVWMAGSATGTDGKSVILVLRNMPTP